MKIAIISGGFDPIHVGHIELMQKAREISDALLVIVICRFALDAVRGSGIKAAPTAIAQHAIGLSDERVQWPEQAAAPPDDILNGGTRQRGSTSSCSQDVHR